MAKTTWILLALACVCRASQGANECVNAATSEGPRTLQNGDAACAPLADGENDTDKGRRFVICSNGYVFTQACSSALRYDVVSKTCTWPEASTCKLGEEAIQTSSGHYPTDSQQPNATGKSTPRVNATFLTTSKATTPKYTQPAGACGPDTCKLPDCFCFGARPDRQPVDSPMFIMLTFDDALTAQLYSSFFKPLLVDNVYNLRNPNGCPIRATFYINHDYTDYKLVKELAIRGNEIASHTINHRLPPGDSSADYPEAVAEITGMRDKVYGATGNKSISDSMVGFRSPYLRVAHDVQFDALRDNNFLYDTSITNIEIYTGRPPLWPFTLDYVMPRCPNVPCPTKPYPGFWEVPINGFIGSNNYSCSMIDTCSVGANVFTASEDDWYTFYTNNFRYFYGTKIPMHLFTHGSMFLRSPPSFDALIRWFQVLQSTQKDVWIVTPKMVIEWMKQPLSLTDMLTRKWGC